MRIKRALGIGLAVGMMLTMAPEARSAGGLDVDAWIARPGVRLVAVEFYATWCKPCMAAVPRWKALHEKYRDEGLRLIVVSTRDPKGACVNPGWNPDDVVCDIDGNVADAMNVGNSLPAAFLWSWRGQLLVRRGHVDEVEDAIKKELASLPRVVLDKDEGKLDKRTREVQSMLRAELARTRKVTVVAGKAERKALAALRKRSHDPRFSDQSKCKLGEELAPNSLLKMSWVKVGTGHRLGLTLLSAESGCLTASSSVSWNKKAPETSVAEAVAELIQALKVPLQMPQGGGAVAAAITERKIGGGDDGWTAGEEGGDLVLASFESDPPGAALSLDGKPLCDKTPCRRAVASGKHMVEMVLADYLTKRESVAVREGQPVRFKLAANFALVTITSDPAGLPFSIDRQEMGDTPRRDLRLTAGAHEVVIDDGCHLPVAETIQVKRGDVRTVSLKTSARKAGIRVLAQDDGQNAMSADIWVDGVKIGPSLKAHTVPLCSTQLRVSHSGYGDFLLELSGPRLAERQMAEVTATLKSTTTTGMASALQLPPGVRGGPVQGESADWRAAGGTQLAIVSFETRPEGATLTVDGQALCQATPCSKALTPGRHKIRLLKARYVEKTETITVKAGASRSIGWTLVPDYGTVDILSDPAGAPVKIDGEPRGDTPLTGLELDAGPHRVVVTDPCYHEAGEQFTMKRGGFRKVTLQLRTRKGGIQVVARSDRGEDVKAEVYLDGKKLGPAPGTFTVPVCARLLEVRHRKHGTWSKELALKEKKTISLVADLRKDIFTAVPATARRPQRGDRVRMIRDYEKVRKGDVGTFYGDTPGDPPAFVLWDRDLGTDVVQLDGAPAQNGHAYWVFWKDLEVLSQGGSGGGVAFSGKPGPHLPRGARVKMKRRYEKVRKGDLGTYFGTNDEYKDEWAYIVWDRDLGSDVQELAGAPPQTGSSYWVHWKDFEVVSLPGGGGGGSVAGVTPGDHLPVGTRLRMKRDYEKVKKGDTGTFWGIRKGSTLDAFVIWDRYLGTDVSQLEGAPPQNGHAYWIYWRDVEVIGMPAGGATAGSYPKPGASLATGTRVEMIRDYEEVKRGDKGTYWGTNAGDPPAFVLWDRKLGTDVVQLDGAPQQSGNAYWVFWKDMKVIGTPGAVSRGSSPRRGKTAFYGMARGTRVRAVKAYDKVRVGDTGTYYGSKDEYKEWAFVIWDRDLGSDVTQLEGAPPQNGHAYWVHWPDIEIINDH